jgi:hypothetical protein
MSRICGLVVSGEKCKRFSKIAWVPVPIVGPPVQFVVGTQRERSPGVQGGGLYSSNLLGFPNSFLSPCTA